MSRQEILQAILVLAETQGKQMSKASLQLFATALGDVTAAQVNEAIIQHLRGPNGRFFPSPGDLLAHIHKYQTVQQAANECLARVIQAVSRFGYVDPDGAKEYLGQQIWDALPGRVGWMDFCQSGEQISQSTARAQLRDRIAAHLQKCFPSGQVALPPPGNPQFKTLLLEEPRQESLTKPSDDSISNTDFKGVVLRLPETKGGTDDQRR